MRYPFVPDIAAGVLKKRDGILAVGILGTIHTSPGEKAGQFSDCDTIQLLVKNVIDAFLQIRDFLFQSLNQAFGNFPQEHPRLTGWVYQDAMFDTKGKAFSGAKIPKKA